MRLHDVVQSTAITLPYHNRSRYNTDTTIHNRSRYNMDNYDDTVRLPFFII